jgi:hypothetical protein
MTRLTPAFFVPVSVRTVRPLASWMVRVTSPDGGDFSQ